MGNEALERELASYVGCQIGATEVGADLVNEPMIRHWCEAMNDRNPVYTDRERAEKSVHGGLVAPPTMMQAWLLRGLEMSSPSREAQDKEQELHQLLTDHGYSSVVATNCEQHYQRYLRPGDAVHATTVIESVSEEKATALGIGYFIDTRTVFRDQSDDEVGSMVFRVLKFKPAQAPTAAAAPEGPPAKPRRLRSPRGHDNAWWWEGIDRGELLIQRCSGCGALRHPPRPMCGKCQSSAWDFIVSKGMGTLYSYVVMHHPPIPGYDYPLTV
ncbi:MAG: MaoC family dehydratase N-terminal domain-containing protein, partial [Myxococcota bacterium]